MSRIVLHRLPSRHTSTGRFLGAIALVVALGAAGAVKADDAPPSNLKLMDNLTSEVVDELLQRFSREIGGHSVLLKPYANNEQYQFMTNVFTRALSERGVTTYPPGATTEGISPFVLQYQAVAFTLQYTKVYRSYVFGGKRVRRRGDISMLVTLVDGTSGAVAGVGEASREKEDQFDFGSLQRMEQGSYQFTRPPLPSGGVKKYAEPVLVTGIVVGLIYLFFSNQSDG